jgi:hypothetical protein
VQPWKEYRMEGNSYFLFSLGLILAIFVLVIAIVAIAIVPALIMGRHHHNGLIFLPLLLLLLIFPVIFVAATLVQFVAPVMYRRRCRAWPAVTDLLSLLGKHLGIFVLYFLFSIVVGIAVAITVMIATCLTCCIAAIPYVGTVILLPIYVFMQSFLLLFLRQFGTEYDVWQGVQPVSTTSTLPPPFQT